jgi:hypothetical protein
LKEFKTNDGIVAVLKCTSGKNTRYGPQSWATAKMLLSVELLPRARSMVGADTCEWAKSEKNGVLMAMIQASLQTYALKDVEHKISYFKKKGFVKKDYVQR